MTRPVLIGIAGGSGSGKTTVIRKIMDRLSNHPVTVIEHDAYYRVLSHLSTEERALVNFDHPDALETNLLIAHLDALLRGESIDKPIYDYATHNRRKETTLVAPCPVIILDGILVLAEQELVKRMDIKIFVDTDDDIRLLRRIRRDMVERGRSIDTILDQYEKTVRPMYLEFVQPSRRVADIIIPRGGENHVAIDMVIARIRDLLQRAE